MPDSNPAFSGRLGLGQHHSMEDAGQKLRRVRERLNLRVRDVEQASLKIADKYRNDDFAVLINRVSEIENRGLIPTIYKLYSLCAIYRLDFQEVLGWYGIHLESLAVDSLFAEVSQTHLTSFQPGSQGDVLLPLSLDPGLDLRLPLLFLEALDVKEHRYGFIGTDDWFMYPLLQPGTFIMVDETVRKIASSGWSNEFERPIYFLEHRQGYVCGWCSLTEDKLILQPHPASLCTPQIYKYPSEIDLVGQITGIASRLDQTRRSRTRS